RWEDQDLGHTAWMTWLFTGDLAAFYQSLRWPGWEAEVAALTGDQCLAAGPPRRVIPTDEAWDLHTSVYFASGGGGGGT
ncbi:MAG TPA: DUF2625 family protein, partial [Kofleriaceae bacterium]|nr:DUF2625 family protein [Kofleriaceae bacterium]